MVEVPSVCTFAFVDESEGKYSGRGYQVVTSLLLPLEKLNEFRKSLVGALSPILSQGENKVILQPELHGSDMLPGENYSDSDRLGCYRIFAQHLVQFNAEVLRLGYFNKSPLFPGESEGSKFAFRAALFELKRLVGTRLLSPVCYVLELDLSKNNQIEGAWNDAGYHHVLPILSDKSNLSIDLDNIVGSFYGNKNNIYLQATDIASWYLLQKQNKADGQKLGDFKERVVEVMKPLDGCVLTDQVIQFNKDELHEKFADYVGAQLID